MALQVSLRQVGGVTVMDLKGDLTVDGGALQFRREAQAALASGQARILVNCDGITNLDSSGLGEFVSLFTAAKAGQGALKLLNLKGRIRSVFETTRLLGVFESFDDEQTAVGSF